MANIVLASGSPRRQELLGRMGIHDFVVSVPQVDEVCPEGLTPEATVCHISRQKSGAVQAEPEDIVITADTMVFLDGRRLGKPRDEADALRKLRSGDMVAAVGVYDDPNSDTVYKFIPGSDASVMMLRTVYHGLSISIEIGEREVSVTVDGAVYSIRYFLCIGQMVVLDGATHQVKFW